MRITAEERERVRKLNLPGTAETRRAIRDYIDRADLSHGEFAERIDYSAAAVKHFLAGRYEAISDSDMHLREAAWNYMRRCPLEPAVSRCQSGELFETESVRIIRKYFTAAVEQGEICLIYGPPGTQKTFALEHLIAERNRAKKNDAIYVYASHDMRSLPLAKRIAREAGIRMGYRSKERCIQNVIDWARQQEHPPAIVIDEAQHLGIGGLETARELWDRGGCGLVLAGSHDLYDKFLKSRAQLEQWLSRIDHKEPLPGLMEEEVREIAETQLGASITKKVQETILDACRVDDIFARGGPKKYYSVRRLVKVLRQLKAARERVA